jgi:phosphatidylserine/phosphatidylglycerophosphate/cardiolipin synthase-like enzyme
MKKKILSFSLFLLMTFSTFSFLPNRATAASPNDVVINEISWMGTTVDYNNEWIELYNNTSVSISLTGWTLKAIDGAPAINLSGSIPAKGYYLLERTSDATVTEATADLIYTGALGNTGETLELRDNGGTLVDSVNSWYAGDNTTKATMERIKSLVSGTDSSNWQTSVATYSGGYGTPKKANSLKTSSTTGEQINTVSDAAGAINVYFNKSALTQYALSGNSANYNVNLETRLMSRIDKATSTLDIAVYDLNLPNLINKIIDKAALGVKVRMITDAKNPTDAEYTQRYQEMRLYIEKMIRGKDGKIGTADDVKVFADSVMFAETDAALRSQYGLPASYSDLPYKTVTVGTTAKSGYFLVDGEKKTDGSYYAPDDQMHNKFVIIDGTWVWTGSFNFTVTDLYGDTTNMANNVLDGNQQHSIEINSPELSSIYKTEFEEMWGSNTTAPNPSISNFHSRKTDNTTHTLTIGGRSVEVYFSPGDGALDHMVNYVKNNANYNAYFSIFAWSSQPLVDELKYKWEGSYSDLQGTRTGFDIRGTFEDGYWNDWWCAAVDMTGRTASQTSTSNPNTRWKNPAPVYPDKETRKLHSKTMLIDADTDSDPTVIIGSTNWSNNGEDVNDENMLIIHDKKIVNQFVQEINARYINAGGTIN